MCKISIVKHNLGGHFRGFVLRWMGGGGKITPCLELVRIMLEKWNLVRKICLLVPRPS